MSEAYFSGEPNFIDHGYYGIQTTSQNRKFKLNFRCKERKRICNLPGHEESNIPELDYFSNQWRMAESFQRDAISSKIGYVSNYA